jgi:hypothetical protein
MNPQTGRFIPRDSYEGGGALSCCKYQQFMNMNTALVHHLYEYTHADPANYLDPSGHEITFRGIVAALMSGPVAVIGRVAQTTRFSCVPYCNVLSATAWSELIQAQWLKAVINGRVIMVLALPTTVENIIDRYSPYNEGLTVFGMELVAPLEAGYTQWVE